MSNHKILCVAGARPNFMKIAPLLRAIEKTPGLTGVLVHTGQHYDEAMSKSFFGDLGIPRPDFNLEVGSGTHAAQTALVMERFEPLVESERPSMVVVVGDVNSTLACALTAVKLQIPVAHVEAGLRSFDRTMPEEINRLATDAISDYLFTTEEDANANLRREGIPDERVHFVGNVMIDTLLHHREQADRSTVLSSIGVEKSAYCLVTLHRPSNVDSKDALENLLLGLDEISKDLPVIFPCHPRTKQRLEEFGLLSYIQQDDASSGIRLLEPLGYLDFLKLMSDASFVVTDSGGIQEETCILQVPCITVRENTERPITVQCGSNFLVGKNRAELLRIARDAASGQLAESRVPDLWDGRAAERIATVLRSILS